MEKLLLRINEAAELLGVGRGVVYQLIQEEKIPYIELGGRSKRIPYAALKQFVEEMTEGGTTSGD